MASQPEVVEIRDISQHTDQTTERKTFRYGHLAGPPRSKTELDAWQARSTRHRLADDLVEFLQRVDGLHLWADLDRGRAYFGLAPLAEWYDASAANAPVQLQGLPAGSFVVSYHENGDDFLVLDSVGGTYRWFDHEDTANPVVIGASLSQVLEWVWERSAEFKPRGV